MVPDLRPDQVVGLWVDIVSAVLFMGLGTFVAFVRPRRVLNLAFALFAFCFGLSFILLNFGPQYFAKLGPAWTNLQTAVNLVWGSAIVIVALRFPVPVRTRERPAILAAAAIAGALAVLQLVTIPFSQDGAGTLLQGLEGIPALLYSYSDSLAYVGLAFFLVLLPLRAARRDATAQGFTSKSATAALALLPYNGLLFGALAFDALSGTILNFWQTMSFVAIMPLTAVTWFVCARRSAGQDRRRALLAGCAALVATAVGVLVAILWPGAFYTSGVLGATRLIGIAVLAYAILRQQLFDIDLRIKASLGHAMLVGFFLAVFLVVEQIVQAFSSQTLGLWAGSIVAGLMLVTLVPLHRMSKRLADRAMPAVRDREPAYLDERKHAIYRDAYATVWEDGSVTRKEMAFLFRMRDSLGLSPEQCARIEAEWNATMRSGRSHTSPAARAGRKPRARHS